MANTCIEELTIKIDFNDIDETTEELSRLVELLKEAKTLIGSIKG